jgi:prolipoprotein diacylglyceryltransferase
MSLSLIAAAQSHRGLVFGIGLVCIGLLHLVFRRYYARRNAAVETARRETAITPFRRRWLWPTSESASLVWGTVISAVMVIVGVILIVAAV